MANMHKTKLPTFLASEARLVLGEAPRRLTEEQLLEIACEKAPGIDQLREFALNAIQEQAAPGEEFIFLYPALIAPYGDESNRDCVGDYFTPSTDFYERHVPTLPLLPYHGRSSTIASEEVHGKAIKLWRTDEGLMALIGVYEGKTYTNDIIAAVNAGTIRHSSKAAMRRPVSIGVAVTHWLNIEVSFILPSMGTACNTNAIAVGGMDQGLTEYVQSVLQLQPDVVQKAIADILAGNVPTSGLVADGSSPATLNLLEAPQELPETEPEPEAEEVEEPSLSDDEATEPEEDSEEDGREKALGEIDMTPEQLQAAVAAAVTAAVTPVVVRLDALEKAAPDGTEKCDCQKTDSAPADEFSIASAVEKAVAPVAEDTEYNKAADALVTGLINAGRLAPEGVKGATMLARLAVAQAATEKAAGPIDLFLSAFPTVGRPVGSQNQAVPLFQGVPQAAPANNGAALANMVIKGATYGSIPEGGK